MGLSPEHRLPPTISAVPIIHQAQPFAEFCTTRNGLLRTGQKLTDDLWQVSTNVRRMAEHEWRDKVGSWRAAAKAHHQKWWAGQAYSPPLVMRKEPGLHPAWRGQLQDLLAADLRWLEEHGWACDQAGVAADESSEANT
jgi:hypothetical protein